MKKKAFTLAEILLTLGIVGVIAATTLPLLNNNTKNVQTTTKLAKAVSEFEQANLALLNEEGVDRLTDAFDKIGTPEYYSALSKHMKISTASAGSILIPAADAADAAEVASDGILSPVDDRFLQEALSLYTQPQSSHISTGSGIDYFILQGNTDGLDRPLPPSQQRLGFLMVDLDGSNGSNKVGVDRFGFAIYNDGSLRAIGSKNWDNAGNRSTSWEAKCPNNTRIPNNEQDALYCTGSIFENDMKIRYSAR